MQTDRRKPNPSPVMMILWVALTSSIIFYAFLAGIVAAPTEEIPIGEMSPNVGLGRILTAVSVIAGVLALIVFYKFRRNAKNYGQLLTTTIIAYALSESVALSGFILAILQRQPELAYPFCGAAVALNLAMYPGLPKNLASMPGRSAGGPSQPR